MNDRLHTSSCTASLVLALAQAVVPLPTIEVQELKDVAVVNALNDAMAGLSEKVTACVTGGRPAETCRCSYPQELASLRTKYEGLMNISVTLVLQNLRRQLETLRCV